MPPQKWKTDDQLRASKNEASRRSWRLQKLRKADALVREAACFLGPKSRCVAYYRKGLRRLGYTLDAQQWAVKHLVAIAGARIIGSYEEAEEEVEERVRAKHPQLGAAIRKCQATPGAVLIIAKLGLTETSTLLFRLSGIHFVACDKPHVNHLTVAGLAVAKRLKEPEMKEARKQSIAAAKARGVRFGPDPSVARAALKIGTETWRKKAKDHAVEALALVDAARRAGYRTHREIAEALNAAGFRTVHDNLWTHSAICYLARWQGTDRPPPEILRIAAEAALRAAISNKKNEPRAASAPANPVAASRSGFVGRPSSRPLVKAELWRRWAAGERHPSRVRGAGESVEAWAKILSKWLATKHPFEPQMGVSAARDVVATWLRELQAAERSTAA